MYRRRPSASVLRIALFPLAFLTLLTACDSGGSGGHGIPSVTDEDETVANDTPATANALKLGTPVRGEVGTAGDVDCFAMQLSAGAIVKFELFGTRMDQGGWDGNTNVPRLTILDTDANTNAKLLEQDYSGNFSDGWSWGFHDLDIPMFSVPADGIYYIAVTQDDDTLDGGTYILRASLVKPSNLQQEAEARGVSGDNDTFATAEPIAAGTMHGFHVAGEADYYTFTVDGPTVVRFELNSYRNGVHDDTALYYDPEVYLFDTDGTTELTSNDDTYFWDSAIEYEIESAGTYYFSVDEHDPGAGEYFLSFTRAAAGGALEAEPNDDTATANTISYGGRRRGAIDAVETDFYSFSGRAGDMVRLQYFDDDNSQAGLDSFDVTLLDTDGVTPLGTGGDSDLQTLTTILQTTGTFYVQIEGSLGPTPYAIELKRFASSTYETEPNDSDVEAGKLVERVSGVIDPVDDVDMFRVSLKQDRLVRLACYASSSPTDSDGLSDYSDHGSDLAPLIELVDALGVVVASSTSVPANGVYTESVTQPLPTCALVTAVAANGTYFVRISDANGASGPSYYYVLEYQTR